LKRISEGVDLVNTSSANQLLSRWQYRLPELEALAGPLLHSPAVQRLCGITFLGILSPRFRDLPGCPLWPSGTLPVPEDGSRFDHSIGVALTALDIARRFGLSAKGQRYSVAWGLTHDIATWPLAHTSEPAFEALTGISPRRLRTAILLGDTDITERYRLDSACREMGLDPHALASLFGGGTLCDDEELALLDQVIHSPLTPDTLEGMWRSGTVFGIAVPAPEEVQRALVRCDRVACLDRGYLAVVREFWERKAQVYRDFINRKDVVLWESAWTLGLLRAFAGLSLSRSLEVREEELIETVLRQGLPFAQGPLRYKEPQEYHVNGLLDTLPPLVPVSELWDVLHRGPARSPNA
jgi:hypothetical protein